MIPVPPQIRQYALEDYSEILTGVIRKCTEYDRVYGDGFRVNATSDEGFVVKARFIAVKDGVKYVADFFWDYVIHGDDVLIGGDIPGMIDDAIARIHEAVESNSIVAAKAIKGQVILAAEGDDDFGDGFASEDPSDGLEGSLNDLADRVEDVQSMTDEMDEDAVAIEKTNNITDHFIVECDGCQGIFISALIESSEPVRTIHGICPLCRKETDQFVKWVIRDAQSDKFDPEDLEFGMPNEEDLV